MSGFAHLSWVPPDEDEETQRRAARDRLICCAATLGSRDLGILADLAEIMECGVSKTDPAPAPESDDTTVVLGVADLPDAAPTIPGRGPAEE